MTKTINFDPHVSEKSRDFIRKCLKVKEEDRMSWEDAFNHPLLVEDQSDKIMRNLRFESNVISNKENSAYRN